MIIAVSQIIARVFVVGNSVEILNDFNFILILLSTSFIAAGGYIINDYFDVKIDLINKPNEVIIGREISRRLAMISHQALSGFGVIMAIFINIKVFIICILAVTLLWAYASFYKKTAFFGNLLVAGMTGASLVIMAVTYEGSDKILNIYALFAFSITLIREIVKDIEDIKGDEKFGCKTLPIVWGIRKTKYFLYILLGIFVILVVSLSMQINNPKLYIIFSFLSIPSIFFLFKLILADRKSHFTFLSKLCKLIMLLGIASMILSNSN